MLGVVLLWGCGIVSLIMRKKFLIKLSEWLAYIVAAAIVFLAVLLSAARLLLPYAPDYQLRAENWASKILQQPVEVKQVEPSWHVFQPQLKFENVQILNKNQSHPLIQIKEIDVGINLLKSLFTWRIVPGVIIISGADLTVTQGVNHKIIVNGIQAPATVQSNDNEIDIKDILGWLFAQGEIYLQNINLIWHDQTGRMLTLQNIKLNLNNYLLSHELVGEATLQQTTPTHVRFVLNVDRNALSNSNFEAQLYLNVKKLVLNQWLKNRSLVGLTIDNGNADAQIWMNWENQNLQSLQTKFTAGNITLKSKNSLQQIILNRLAGNVLWQREKDGWNIAGDNMQMMVNNHFWPKSQFSFQSNNAQQIFQISYMNIQDAEKLLLMTTLLPNTSNQWLEKLQPQGLLKKLTFTYQTPSMPQSTPADRKNYSLKAQLENFSCLPWQKIPGIDNLTGNIVINPTSGSLDLQSKQITLNFGHLFAQPLLLTSLSGLINWEQQNQTWEIIAKKIAASDANASAQGDMELTLPNNHESPEINLLGAINLMNAPAALADLPVGKMPPAVVNWLHSAIVEGNHASASIILRGPINAFPFLHKEGRFIVDGNFNHVTLNYRNAWPVIKDMSGHLLFDDASMQIHVTEGKIFSATLNNADATIPNLQAANLQITGNASGDLNDGYLFLEQSPLYETIGKRLEGFQMQGPMNLALQLTIPLAKNLSKSTQVNGNIELKEGDLLLPEWWNIHMSHLQGDLQFTADSLSGNMVGQFYNQPVTIGIATQQSSSKSPPTTQINFSNISMSIKQIEDLFALRKIPYVSGTTQYGLQLQLVGGAHPKDKLTIHSNLQGVAVDLPSPFNKPAKTATPFDLQLNFSEDQALQWLITYESLHLQLQRQANTWNVAVDSPSIAGNMIVPTDFPKEQLVGNFDHVFIPAGGKQQSGLTAGEIPALKIDIKDFHYGDKDVGSVAFNVAPQGKNTLKIYDATLKSPTATLNARGSWTTKGTSQQTFLAGQLDSQDFGGLLKTWDITNTLVGANGTATFNLRWQGLPYEPALGLASMNGGVHLQFYNGRIINLSKSTNAELGIGRVLNLLSLSSLPRRLRLDFSDLAGEGLAFDVMQGDFVLKNGNAITQNAYLNGTVAKVNLNGRIGLSQQDYDLDLLVAPHVTASLPVVATITGGPIVGAVSWLVEKVVGSAVSKLTTNDYHVTGSWSNPTVEKRQGNEPH
jgi:uncharacterized protein YhdP